MKITRALWTGTLSWILVFFEVSVLMFGFGIQNTDTSVTHHFLFVFAILIPAYLYFKKAPASVQEGIYLTLIYLGVSLVLDAIITIPLFIKDYAFLLNPYHLIDLAISFSVTIVLGALMKK